VIVADLTAVVGRLALLVAVAVASALLLCSSAAGYPRKPVGSVLYRPSLPRVQFILVMPDTGDLSRLFGFADFRRELLQANHLSYTGGHLPDTGYVLNCRARTVHNGITFWLSAWNARSARAASTRAFNALTRGRSWIGGCQPRYLH
jgi:hypothetical protein